MAKLDRDTANAGAAYRSIVDLVHLAASPEDCRTEEFDAALALVEVTAQSMFPDTRKCALVILRALRALRSSD